MMGRKQTIDRNAVLTAAEAVVSEVGAAALTIEAVAARAGVSKGGVLYCYPTKSRLIGAMLERDLACFARDVERYAADHPDDPNAVVLGHIAATRHEPESCRAKAC
jgi:AcrR family transcriptional regulator